MVPKATRKHISPEAPNRTLSQAQAEFLYALSHLHNDNAGEGVSPLAIARFLNERFRRRYPESKRSSAIPKLVFQLRRDKKIPIINLLAEHLSQPTPEAQTVELEPSGLEPLATRPVGGYGLRDYQMVILPRTARFLIQFKKFASKDKAVETDVRRFREYLVSQGGIIDQIDDDLQFALKHKYLMGLPKRDKVTHLRAGNRLTYELRYLMLLSADESNTAKGGEPLIGGVRGLSAHQLRAKSHFCDRYELLDREGSLVWQRLLRRQLTPELRMFWVAVPLFRDGNDEDLLRVLKDNLVAGVRYIYFVPEDDLTGKFDALRTGLVHEMPDVPVIDRLHGVALTKEEITSHRVNHLIANPQHYLEGSSVAFQGIRHDDHELSDISIRLARNDVRDIVLRLLDIGIKRGHTREKLFGDINSGQVPLVRNT